jgi:hypothetical protein
MKSTSSSGLRTILLLALGAFALGAFAPAAAAQDIAWSATSGTPSIPVNKIAGFFIWHVKTEVYITTANKVKKGDLFTGNITVTGGTISGLTGTQLEKNDYLHQTGSNSVTFNFHTYTGHDGLHFKLTGGTTLAFTATENGFSAASIIYYGSKKTAYKGSNPATFNLSK